MLASYDGFELDKVPAVAYEAGRVKSKKPLSSIAEKEIRRLYTRYLEDNGKSYRHVVEVGKEVFKIVEANKSNQVLLSLNGYYVFFDLQQDKYTKWREIRVGGSSNIPWPNKTIGVQPNE